MNYGQDGAYVWELIEVALYFLGLQQLKTFSADVGNLDVLLSNLLVISDTSRQGLKTVKDQSFESDTAEIAKMVLEVGSGRLGSLAKRVSLVTRRLHGTRIDRRQG